MRSVKLSIWIFFFLSIFLLLVYSCSAEVKEDIMIKVSTIKQGINPEYLTFSEKIILDFYGNEEDRENSLSLLKNRCEDKQINNSHACYNYAVLLFNLQRHEESLEYIKKAVEKSPDDILYNSMFRNMATLLENPESLEGSKEGSMLATITRLEVACRNKNEEQVVIIVKQLIESKVFHETFFKNGPFSECLSKEQKVSMLSVPKNLNNYKELFFQEKANSDPFSSVWDVGYFIKKIDLEKEASVKNAMTESWKNLRLATISGDTNKAKIELKSFLDQIRKAKEQKKANQSKYIALERAAYYLIEQDDFFKKIKDQLLVEF